MGFNHKQNENNHYRVLEKIYDQLIVLSDVNRVEIEFDYISNPPIDYVIWTDKALYVGEMKYNNSKRGRSKADHQIKRNTWNMRNFSNLLYGVYCNKDINHQT